MSNILDRLNIDLNDLSDTEVEEIHKLVEADLTQRKAPEMMETVNHFEAMLPYHKSYMRGDFEEVLLMDPTAPEHVVSIDMYGHTASVENMEWNTGVEI